MFKVMRGASVMFKMMGGVRGVSHGQCDGRGQGRQQCSK